MAGRKVGWVVCRACCQAVELAVEPDAVRIEAMRVMAQHRLVCLGETKLVHSEEDIPERFQRCRFFRLERV